MRTGSEYEKPNRDKEAKAVDSFESEVDHPDRYANTPVEAITAMRYLFGDKAVLNFCLCNTFKYLWRRGKKTNADDTEERDIQKALWYFDKAKETINSKDLADEINTEIKARKDQGDNNE